jgi:microsomal epoxide hydrolase
LGAFVTSDGVRLNVLEAGDPRAPLTLLLVPGWSLPASIWQPVIGLLARQFRIVALDPRGQGESEVPASGYTIGRRADDLGEFIAAQGRVVLVGWSLGALEALHYVHRHGEARLRGLVIVDSSVGEPPAPPEGAAFRDALRADREATVSAFVRAIFSTPQSEDALQALERSALRMPLEASLSLFPSDLPREHWRELAENLQAPLLYAVTPQFAAQAENLKAARPATWVQVFEQAGHALFVDEPARFASLLAGFAISMVR